MERHELSVLGLSDRHMCGVSCGHRQPSCDRLPSATCRVFAIIGSLALAALSSFFLVNELSQHGISAGGPLYVAGVPFNLNAVYALTASASVAVAALAWWSSKRYPTGNLRTDKHASGT
jgi:hypothetical protein